MERAQRARQVPGVKVRAGLRRLAEPGRTLFGPGMWPPKRIVLESLLSVVLATLVAGTEAVRDGGAVQLVAVALAAGLVSPLRRVLPATVLLVAIAASFPFSGFALLIPVASWSAGRRIDGVGRATGIFALAYVLDFAWASRGVAPRLAAWSWS